MDDGSPSEAEITRAPTDDDLVILARTLNEAGVRYIVVGGFAIINAGFVRGTMDIDLLVDTSPENDALLRKALEYLPDKAVLELGPGEIENYVVVRICEDFTIDLMAKACGLTYLDAESMIDFQEHHGVRIPFASPSLLWKTKQTYRDKDAVDRTFLRRLLEDRGEWPVV